MQTTTKTSALSWFNIPTAQFERGVTFYEAILEEKLSIQPWGPTTIAVLPHAEDGVGGSLSPGTPSETGSMVYLNVAGRLDRTLALVERSGGRIHAPKFALPNGQGYSALIVDSEGNLIGLHANA